MAVTMGSFWFLGIKIIIKKRIFSFIHDALQEMCIVFQKVTSKNKHTHTLKKQEKQLTIFKSLPQPFGSMYFH